MQHLLRLATRLLSGATPVLLRVDLESRTLYGLRDRPLPSEPVVRYLCEATLAAGAPFSVSSAREDLRVRREWADLPDANLAFLGVPVADRFGRRRGVVAALAEPGRAWSGEDADTLGVLAASLTGELEREALAREAEELAAALSQSQSRYHRLLTTCPSGIYALDLDGRVTELNRAACEILGRSASDVVGRSFGELIVPEERELAAAAFREVCEGQDPLPQLEVRILRSTGERRLVQISRARIVEGGVVLGVQGIARDITEERDRETQLRRAGRMSSIAPLLSGICHELNNPLTSIKSFAELLLLDERPDEDREAIEIMQREAHRAASIVSDLRIVARQSQDTGANRGTVLLNEIVQMALATRRDALRGSGVELVVELDERLPPVLAVRPHLEQVVRHLIANAEKALLDHPGERVLQVRSYPSGGGVALLVADSGPGIPGDHLERIFDPFWTTRGPGDGTGLGLSLVHSIVEDHGGRIRVDSTPGCGAVFTVELPAAEAAPVCDSGAAASRSLRVLVVDDEAPIRTSLARYLERRGHQVDEAVGGGAALELLTEATDGETFDIVVADLRMPGLDGGQLLQELRARGGDLQHRLIFITGDADSPDADQMLRDANVPVILKPFELAEVAQIIEAQAGLFGA